MARSQALSREAKALKLVCRYERRRGGKPTRSLVGTGYDMESRGRKIEIKTIPRVKGGFVKLGALQYRTLRKNRNFWLYLVDISKTKPRVFEFSRAQVLPKIRKYAHYDFIFGKRDLR